MTVAAAYPPPRPRRTRVAVTAHSVPNPEPPFDDRRRSATARRSALRPYPTERAAAALRLVTAAADAAGEPAPPAGEPAPLEAAAPRAALLTRALLETIAGLRPLGQLDGWLAPDVLTTVRSMTASRSSRPAPTALRRVLVSEPAPGVAEVTAIVQRGARAEAMALRMEGLDGRWVVTALQRA